MEFKFDLEGEVAKIESTPANSTNVANRKKIEEANSKDSRDSQPAPTVEIIKPKSDSQNSQRHPEILQFLPGIEREVWQDYYNVAIGQKFKMTPDEASREANKRLVESINTIQRDNNKKNFKRDGYLKIFSTKLDQLIYICRDSIVAKKFSDKKIPVFTLRELKALDGRDKEEAMLLIEAKILFNGRLIKPKDNE